jgi:hypothetical protein
MRIFVDSKYLWAILRRKPRHMAGIVIEGSGRGHHVFLKIPSGSLDAAEIERLPRNRHPMHASANQIERYPAVFDSRNLTAVVELRNNIVEQPQRNSVDTLLSSSRYVTLAHQREDLEGAYSVICRGELLGATPTQRREPIPATHQGVVKGQSEVQLPERNKEVLTCARPPEIWRR